MLHIRIADVGDENNPSVHSIESIKNWKGILAAKTYEQLLADLVEALNNETIDTTNNWTLVTGEAEEPNS